MAKKKSIKKTPVILRNALSVYERSITRFSDVVCQFTVQNGNQITYDVLEVSANPDPTPRVERSITRFKEVVCEFVVIDGTDVHAYELEPVYVDLTGGGTTYTITNNLTNVTNSNAAASIGDGDPYNATLTADAGYTIDSVVVTMGGIDVTSSVYNAGVISIPAVTGDIIITASAAVSYKYLWSSTDGDFTFHHGAVDWSEAHSLYLAGTTGSVDKRRAIYINDGVVPFNYTTDDVNFSETDPPKYPIPIPADATSVTFTVTPNTQYGWMGLYKYNADTGVYDKIRNTAWAVGTDTQAITPGEADYLIWGGKYNSGGNNYQVEPELVIEFGTE